MTEHLFHAEALRHKRVSPIWLLLQETAAGELLRNHVLVLKVVS